LLTISAQYNPDPDDPADWAVNDMAIPAPQSWEVLHKWQKENWLKRFVS
jgi:hypothetical protein